MNRQFVYPGAVPLETDLLNTNKYAMVGLAKLAAAILGTSTYANGLACTQQTVANMTVQIGAGEIYALAQTDATAYSSLSIDTHMILKQGIALDTQTLSGFSAPLTNGYSVNYLVEASYADVDGNNTVLPYFNSANPNQAYFGPNGDGASQPTTRQGTVVLTAKAGTAAPTGTQTTPSADPGNIPLWVVTIANGQTSITSANIAIHPSAPFLYPILQEWSSTQSYPNEAYVTRNGATYTSLQASIGQDPAVQTAYWVQWGYNANQLALITPAQNKLFYLTRN